MDSSLDRSGLIRILKTLGLPPDKARLEALTHWLTTARKLASQPLDPCPTLPKRRRRLQAIQRRAAELSKLLSEDPYLPLCVPGPVSGNRELIEATRACLDSLVRAISPGWRRLESTSVALHLKARGAPLNLGRRNLLWCLLDAYEDLTDRRAELAWNDIEETCSNPSFRFVKQALGLLGAPVPSEVSLFRALLRARADREGSEPVNWELLTQLLRPQGQK